MVGKNKGDYRLRNHLVGEVMSEPEIGYYVERFVKLMDEIDQLVAEPQMTNSKREIIYFNTNEAKLNLYLIMNRLGDKSVP